MREARNVGEWEEREYNVRRENERARVRRARSRRARKVSSLDVLLFVIAGLLLMGIVAMIFGMEAKDFPTGIRVIWWTFVSMVGAWVASFGM